MKLSLLKPLFIGIILLCLWQLIGVFGDFPHYIFPSPQAVWLQLTSHSELLWQHTLITLIEIGLGLLLGFIFGLSSASYSLFHLNIIITVTDFSHFSSNSCFCYRPDTRTLARLWYAIKNCYGYSHYLFPL